MEEFMTANAEKMLRLIRIVAADLPEKKCRADSVYSGLEISVYEAKKAIVELHDRKLIYMSDKKIMYDTKIKVV